MYLSYKHIHTSLGCGEGVLHPGGPGKAAQQLQEVPNHSLSMHPQTRLHCKQTQSHHAREGPVMEDNCRRRPGRGGVGEDGTVSQKSLNLCVYTYIYLKLFSFLVDSCTFSQGRSGHLARDSARRLRAEAWNVRMFPNQDMTDKRELVLN